MDWLNVVPPLRIEKPPTTRDDVFIDLSETDKTVRRSWFRRAALLAVIWHEGWFIDEDHPEKKIQNMSRYLLVHHDVDVSVKELKESIITYDTVVAFDPSLHQWIMGWPISAAYLIAKAIREVLGQNPLEMSEDDIAAAWEGKIKTMVAVLNKGKVTVREVRPILVKAGILEANDDDDDDVGGGGEKGGRRSAVDIALKVIQDSPDGFVGDLYVGRHQKKKRATEARVAEMVSAIADQEDTNRDDAIVMLIEAGYKKLGRSKDKDAA